MLCFLIEVCRYSNKDKNDAPPFPGNYVELALPSFDATGFVPTTFSLSQHDASGRSI